MSQVNTQQMGRLVAAGSIENLDEAVNTLARLEALHIIDYDGSEDGFSLGSPNPSSEDIGKVLVRARSAASIISTDGPDKPVPQAPVRESLSDELPSKIDELLQASSRMDDLENEISALEEEMGGLSMVAPLGIDIELLGGYDSVSSFVGTVTDTDAAAAAVGQGGILFQAKKGNQNVVAAFVRSEESQSTASSLESAGFESLPLPEGSGSASERLETAGSSRDALVGEKNALMEKLTAWEESNGEMLACGLEVLERDHDVLTAPVRIAVSEHAFVLDGWLVMGRAEEVQKELNQVCLYTEVTPFEMEAGGGGHGHSDHDHHQEMPPIAFQERNTSKPMELLTDAVGRPAYGRIDPTVFMLVTYPIFFGIMLGDMAYGLITMGLGIMLIQRSGTNEMLNLGGKFLMYIGVGTVVFGYLYAEFAGWEIFPHHGSNPAEALQFLYPAIDQGAYHAWSASFPLGIELAFPFHRVVMVSDHGNLEHLILLTIYLGVIHVFLGLIIGFRDIMLYGNGHGGVGFVCAFFEKGVWMLEFWVDQMATNQLPEEASEVEVFVETNDNFRLPADPNTPVIMVGPGTGIAPFRSFMQERDVQGAEGKNWLFFGNPHFTQDFLYQVEWQSYVKEGLLDKITLAFSRDQEEKVYVQHRLLENGKEVYEWLEQGAHFYVCGDAMHMAKDVENALISIVQEHGGKSEADAKAYVVELRKAKRYQKDVY